VPDGAIGGCGLVVEDEVRVGSDPPVAVEQDRGGVEVMVAGAPADGDGERGMVEGDVLARAQWHAGRCGGGLLVAEGCPVGFGVAPVVGGLDAGFEACVFAQEVEQVGAVEEFDGFAVGEVVGGFAVAAGGDEDAFGGAFVLQGAVEVADGGDADGVALALGLDDDLAAHDRPGIDSDAVDAAVAGGAGLAGVQAHASEQVLDQAFELGRAHGEQGGGARPIHR